MERLSKRSQKGAKYVDKLAKVYLKNGEEKWILIHIEVQSYVDREFSKRMFRYFYRIFDRYDKEIVSMALLTNSKIGTPKGRYELLAYGSGVVFEYLSFGLLSYDKFELDKSNNPIAMVVLTSQEKEMAKRKGEKFDAKLRLARRLYEKGYTKDDVIALFEFIDWSLQLDSEEDELFLEKIREIEGEKNMPYITSVEIIGIKKGLERGVLGNSRKMVLEALEVKFGEIPQGITESINNMDNADKLNLLHRQAIKCASLSEFKKFLDEHNAQ